MEIIKYNGNYNVADALKNGEPLLAVVSFNGKEAVVSHVDDAVEHHILLMKAERKGTDIDKYFRIVFDRDGADWTFICPPDYKNIADKTRRTSQFYKDGFSVIAEFLAEIGYFCDISIPKRYRRHIEELRDG